MKMYYHWQLLKPKKNYNISTQIRAVIALSRCQLCQSIIILAVALSLAIPSVQASIDVIISSDFDQEVGGNTYLQDADFFGGDGLPPMGVLAAAMIINNFNGATHKEQYFEASATIPFKITRNNGNAYDTSKEGTPGMTLTTRTYIGTGGQESLNERNEIVYFSTDQNGMSQMVMHLGLALYAHNSEGNNTAEGQVIVDPVLAFLPDSWALNNLTIWIPVNGKDETEGWVAQNLIKRDQEWDKIMGFVETDPSFSDWTRVLAAKLDYSVVPEPSTIIAGALLLLPFGLSTLRILRHIR